MTLQLRAGLLLAASAGMLCAAPNCIAQSPPIGVFQHHADIGNPKLKGSAAYNSGDQSYDLKGGGYNVWFNRDEFQYAYSRITGDFILTANVKFVGEGGNPHRKIGWMVRATEQADAAHVSAVVHGNGLTLLQWRPVRGAPMRDPQDEIVSPKKNVQILQLERSGNTFIMRTANPGEPLQETGRTNAIDMPKEALAGLFVCSHDADQETEAVAWNVRIEKPAPDTHDGSQNVVLGSRLELMNVFDGKRLIIHEDSGRFEAPNWMPGGQKLLFNKGGLIYTIPIDGGTPEQLNTGSVTHNNNDHVISFDGKMLGVSSQRAGMPGGGSTVYVLPLTGGEPTMVTDSTPSYMHGWNPNGNELAYTGKRESRSLAFNIYKKPLDGGPEVRLTFNATGLSDGPEYSPDGQHIYYNSNETGTMQVWRMRPDGSAKEQLTFDEYNSWFPHISPDGKWMVMISFPITVDAGDHPFYKRVMLRLMPVSGGAPRVIAYLYGGQGTINTPSWSPDSKRIAFVSNSGPLQ